MSPGERRYFGHREFAGYLKVRIPHRLDDKVLTDILDPRKRVAMTSEDVSVLAVFGHRKAVEAVRTSNVQALIDGFLAVAVAIDLNGDMREVFMGLAPLFHSAELLSTRPEDILAALKSAGVSAQSGDAIRGFAERSARDRSIAAFGIKEEGSGINFRYM